MLKLVIIETYLYLKAITGELLEFLIFNPEKCLDERGKINANKDCESPII
jgi:hypothetical protein